MGPCRWRGDVPGAAVCRLHAVGVSDGVCPGGVVLVPEQHVHRRADVCPRAGARADGPAVLLARVAAVLLHIRHDRDGERLAGGRAGQDLPHLPVHAGVQLLPVVPRAVCQLPRDAHAVPGAVLLSGGRAVELLPLPEKCRHSISMGHSYSHDNLQCFTPCSLFLVSIALIAVAWPIRSPDSPSSHNHSYLFVYRCISLCTPSTSIHLHCIPHRSSSLTNNNNFTRKKMNTGLSSNPEDQYWNLSTSGSNPTRVNLLKLDVNIKEEEITSNNLSTNNNNSDSLNSSARFTLNFNKFNNNMNNMNNNNSEMIKQLNDNIAASDDTYSNTVTVADTQPDSKLKDGDKNDISTSPPLPPPPPPSGSAPESVEALESENESPLDNQQGGLKFNNSTDPDQVKLLGSKALAGISEFPKQTYNISKRKGGQFTMMLVGKSGVGKTSFINTLLNANAISDHMNIYRTQIPQKTTSICIHELKLEEGGYNMDLNIIDTPGYGDLIDNRFCWYGPAKYIDDQFRLVIRQELQPSRENLKHTEVNLCLYFLNYSSRGLNALDLQAIKKLAERVNLIPIVSKVDSCTKIEIENFKQKVQNTLINQKIKVCPFLQFESIEIDKIFRSQIPFSIINSKQPLTSDTKSDNTVVVKRGRNYNWGFAQVDNLDHCDFLNLKKFIIDEHMVEFITSTKQHYELFRKHYLTLTICRSMFSQESEKTKKYLIDGKLNKERVIPRDFDTTDLDKTHQLIKETHVFDSLKLVTPLTLDECDLYMIQYNPYTVDSETKLKNYYSKLVSDQNLKFKQWKSNLLNKQQELNDDINNLKLTVSNLQESVKSLS